MLMLHAINQGKTKFYKRYLGHREDSEPRVGEEDEITSLIMTPLSLLPDNAIGAFWKALLEWQSVENLPLTLPNGSIRRAIMEFWPRRDNIEPDMLVDLEWQSGEKRYLLVEFKWKAPLSGAKQLHNQWQKFFTEEERQKGYHVFIAPELSAGYHALGEKDVWKGRLLLRSWFHILNMLQQEGFSEEAEGLQRWSIQVQNLLKKFNIRPFKGFQGIGTLELPDYPLDLLRFFQSKDKESFFEKSIVNPNSTLFFSKQ